MGKFTAMVINKISKELLQNLHSFNQWHYEFSVNIKKLDPKLFDSLTNLFSFRLNTQQDLILMWETMFNISDKFSHGYLNNMFPYGQLSYNIYEEYGQERGKLILKLFEWKYNLRHAFLTLNVLNAKFNKIHLAKISPSLSTYVFQKKRHIINNIECKIEPDNKYAKNLFQSYEIHSETQLTDRLYFQKIITHLSNVSYPAFERHYDDLYNDDIEASLSTMASSFIDDLECFLLATTKHL